MEAFESRALDLPDFYFTGDDYRYRFEAEAKRRFLDLLQDRFRVGVGYNGHTLRWDTVIERKAVELGRYLVGRTGKLNFSDPLPNLTRTDDSELRKRILNLSQPEAEELGIGRSTLHYLRKNAKSTESLRTYKKVRDRLKVSDRVQKAPEELASCVRTINFAVRLT
jgi:CRISPR-associated protein Cas1